MILYASKDMHFAATKADAEEHKRETGSPYMQVDLPPSGGRPAFADFLNATVAAARRGKEPEQSQEVSPTTVPQPSTTITLTDVEEFIQSARAAPELARIADNVCWRLKELLKGITP